MKFDVSLAYVLVIFWKDKLQMAITHSKLLKSKNDESKTFVKLNANVF